ncbi:MAG TPA: Hsp20/alpha crystallin family protein [Candidatus Acidoferrales bacterium]|nr:Hsp20/alpha crystallin family protein [Candidatus Acidoferrales bacterium]
MALPSVIDEIDRLFDELVHRRWGGSAVLTPVELRTVEDGWSLEIPTQGMRAKDLTVEVQGRQLVVRGQRRSEEEQEQARGWTKSQSSASFSRTITLPVATRLEDLDVHLEDSILKIHIRRRQP